jgi:hypothetical protein
VEVARLQATTYAVRTFHILSRTQNANGVSWNRT